MMPYTNFPAIERLSDVTPFLTPGINVKERDDYTVVDYDYITPETFTNPIALECRGLKFDTEGNLIARPFHKFFNVGERQGIDEIDWSQEHWVEEKLDGSMVHGVIVDDFFEFMTRGGITPQAIAAKKLLTEDQRNWLIVLCAFGYTPIFEYTAPDNQVVIEYPKPELTLLDIRHNLTGAYQYDWGTGSFYRETLRWFPEANRIRGYKSESLIKNVRDWDDCEGVVIKFHDGHRLKVKADDYVLKHKTLGSVVHEKNLMKLIVQGEIDDILPILSEGMREKVKNYRDRVELYFNRKVGDISRFLKTWEGVDRKTFAHHVRGSFNREIHSVVFKSLDNGQVVKNLEEWIIKHCSSRSKLKKIKHEIPVKWELTNIAVEELHA